MKRAVAIAALAAGTLLAGAQKLPWQTSASMKPADNQLVHYLYPQQVTVPAGKAQTIELHFRINPGLHINSHQPRQKSLIRTELIAAEPNGVKISAVDFPPGSDYAFPAGPAGEAERLLGRLRAEDAPDVPKGEPSGAGRAALSGVRYQHVLSAAEPSGGGGRDWAVREQGLGVRV